MLKEYRIKKGFAQEEMAELLNISWHHYQRIEIGKGTPSLETFIDIIEILKIPNDEAIILLKSFKRTPPFCKLTRYYSTFLLFFST